MENLSPSVLDAIREIRWKIASGASMNVALRHYLDFATSAFSHRLREWYVLVKQGRTPAQTPQLFHTPYQQAFVELIGRGVKGEPTLSHLTALEEEVERAANAELELHIASLPFKVLIPLLLFQFPAYLILLLGPILRELSQSLGGI